MKYLFLITCFLVTLTPKAQNDLETDLKMVESKVIEWRRHFHEHPELSYHEYKTAEKIAEYLKSLGIEVQTGVAKTGVVGLLHYWALK